MAAPRYLNIVAGVPTQIAASESTAAEVIVATNAGGTIDPSFLPPGVGVEVIMLTASEALSAGAFVNVWNNSGTPNVRNANATTSGKEAHGYVISSFSSSATATVYLSGRNVAALGGGSFTAGDIWLATTAGQATQTPPSAAGNVVQQIGFAYSTVAAQFNPGQQFVLA